MTRPRSTMIALFVVVLVLVVATAAQDLGVRISNGTKALTLDHVLRGGFRLMPRGLAGLQWHPDGERFTWVKRVKGKPALVAASVNRETSDVVLDAAAVQAAWKKAGYEGRALRISPGLRWNDGGKSLRLFQGGALYRIDLKPVKITRLHKLPGGANPVAFSSGDRRVSFVKDFNIHVVKEDGSTVQVTRDGYEDLTHGVSVSRSEFGIHDGMWWDPTGRRLAFYREDLRPIEPYPYADFKKRPARRVHGRYPMAGRKGSIVQVGVYDSRSDDQATVVWLDSDPRADDYLTNVTWGPEGKRLYVAHVNRGQDTMTLVEYAAATGKRLRVLFSETDKEWIEPEHGPVFLPDGSRRFLWFSPRDGFRHLYLYTREGKLVRKVVEGDFDVAKFTGWEPGGKGFYFETTGPNPLEWHLYHASLSGGERAVTHGRGRHKALVSPSGRYVLDSHTHLELPLAVDLLTGLGETVRRIHEVPNPLKAYRMGTHRFFTVKSEDGRDLHGHVIFPPDLDPKKKYPVIQYVYGGPHSQLVQDWWLGGRGRWVLWLHYMAARGYVVLRLDNRGTANRGIEFEQVLHRRLGTCELADQLRGLDHVLGLGFADPDRVGIHGWSYGGFLTLSLMTRAGKRYRAGVAGAPVTDWAYYETGYGERYMDTPEENRKGYRTANPSTHVKGIQGSLLVVHGSSDRTVMWQNTIDFLDRCIRADIEVETMIYPGQKHGFSGKSFSHFLRKLTKFFDRELLDPR